MRSPADGPSERARSPRPRPPGGKALQRLLLYLLERDPAMIAEVVPVKVPAAAQPPAPEARSAGEELSATLERLAGLRDKGLITPEEYEAKKAQILERM